MIKCPVFLSINCPFSIWFDISAGVWSHDHKSGQTFGQNLSGKVNQSFLDDIGQGQVKVKYA